ncbi:pseudouridine synthase [Trinickia sp. NRRL B-1857]|uniref:pseudouridine synthase n=1 Tax=Trinickia sp. NRRL B-1857 TaxID=3162879 RepID=UPI003D2AF1C6
MRVKLTAKHPRPASPSRAPVRAGSPSARKTPRADVTHSAPAPKAAAPRSGAKAGAPASAAPRRDSAAAKPPRTGVRPSQPRDGRGSSEKRGARDTTDTRYARGPRDARGSRDESGRDETRRSPRATGHNDAAPGRRSDDAPRRSPRSDRPPRDAGSRPPRDAGSRPPRDAGSRPPRDAGSRPPRDAGSRPPRDAGSRPPRDAGSRPAREPATRSRRGEDDAQTRTFARPVKGGASSPRSAEPRRESGFSRTGMGAGAKPGTREGRGPSEARGRPSETKRPAAADWKTGAPRAAKPLKALPVATGRAGGGADAEAADGLVRLSKRMSELGLCSRREADEWIENGWVRVDGERIDTLGSRVRPDQHIEVTRDAQAAQSRQVTILLHKPVGYVSGQAEDGYEPAITLITAANRWEDDRATTRFVPSQLRALAPAGRLDIDSTGLLVLTQDGRIAKQLIGENSSVEKEYLVRVNYGDHTTDVADHFPAEKLALLRYGLSLDGAALKPAKVSWQNGEQLRFVLREGKKRQIRRMCELVGLHVVGLKRVRMGSVVLGALPQGKWRYLLPNEAF